MEKRLAPYTPYALSLLRIITGFLFIPHGGQKMFGLFGGHGPAPLLSQSGIAGILELYGGILFMLGLLTRPVAFLLCGEMAVAYFQAHSRNAFLPIENKGELAVLYCFVFLLFVFSGAGPISLDWLIRGRKRADRDVSLAA